MQEYALVSLHTLNTKKKIQNKIDAYVYLMQIVNDKILIRIVIYTTNNINMHAFIVDW